MSDILNKLKTLATEMRRQDNYMTQNPVWVVRDFHYVECPSDATDWDIRCQDDDDDGGEWSYFIRVKRFGHKYFMTEKSCNEYIEQNRHHFEEAPIPYAFENGDGNPEFNLVIEAIFELTGVEKPSFYTGMTKEEEK